MTKKEIEKIAKKLRKESGTNDIYDIISDLNITIKSCENKSHYIKLQGKKYIFLNRETPEEEKEFAIAHELGHAILHDCEINQNTPNIRRSQQIENEANYFAFVILGKKIDKTYQYTTSQYARQLGVSEETIIYVTSK